MFTHLLNLNWYQLDRIRASETLLAEETAKTLTFTDKASYVTWRAEWRALYGAMSRAARGRSQSGDRIIPQNTRDLRWLMMHIRKQSKLLAQEQYLAARTVV